MGGGKKKQTIGYKYFFSLHMGIGRGPVNEIAEIRVGDIPAYTDSINLKDSSQLVSINKPELFGGEKKEGGIQGPMYCYNGARTQNLQPATATPLGILPSIATALGGDVPAFRGVVTLWFDGMVAAMNPYPKEWSFRVRRSDAGWWNNDPWYPEKARVLLFSENGGIIHAMNGAHILYEVNTNPEWGRGMPPELIDENSFIRAANTLCAEGLGLCIPWFRQEDIKEFIPVVINHIGGVQYVDRETGKLTLRLIRGDYNVEDLPLFTPDTGLLDVLDDDSSGEEGSYNEIIVKGFDPTTKEDIMVRVQNLASIQSQGEIISNTAEYRGLSTRALCGRVALRELKVQLPLRKMTVVLDRRGWRVTPGMPFRISHPEKGISNLILRAGECRDGTLTDGKISVKAVQDIFGMPDTEYTAPTGSGWTPPSFAAAPSPESRLYEINWRDFVRGSTAAEQDAVKVGTSYAGIIAKDPPNVQTQGYDVLMSLTSGSYPTGSRPTAGFTTWAVLEAGIGPLDTSLTVKSDNLTQFTTEFTDGMVVLIDDEQIQFVSFNATTRIATLKRGVADTIPASHTANTTVWLIDDEIGSDKVEYQDGETVYAKALTRTSTDLLAEGAATELSLEVNQRVFRPYPPGDVKVEGVSIYTRDPEEYIAEPEITWTHRDRKNQADVPVGHTEASVGPETDVTYNIRVYDTDGTTLLRETDVGAVDTWTYGATMQGADGNPEKVWIELESVRDGLASQFLYRFHVVIVGGWGYGWGENWGGV